MRRLAILILAASMGFTSFPIVSKSESIIPSVSSKVYRIEVQTGLEGEDVILTLGTAAYGVKTTEEGYLFVMTEKKKGFFYVEFDNVMTKYYFEDGVVTGSEEVTPSIISITGNTSVTVGDTLHLFVDAKAVTSGGKLKYQWYKDGLPLEGKTDSTLRVKNVSFEDAGNYSVEVSQAGMTSRVTRSSAQQVTVVVDDEIFQGEYCYNVTWEHGGVEQVISCKSNVVETTYSLVEGDCAVLEGNVLKFHHPGRVKVLVSDGTNSIEVEAVCDTAMVRMDGVRQDFVYDGLQHPVDYNSVDGISECMVSYRDVDSASEYTYDAPVNVGRYCAKIEMKTASGEELVRFLPITISPKKLDIFNLGVVTKEYDQTTSATLKGELIGTYEGDSVRLSVPVIEFEDANAGSKKPIKVIEGELRLIGIDAPNYKIDEYDITKLKGRILKKVVTVHAVSKFSTEGEIPQTLTYTTSGNVGEIPGVRIDCDVTEGSKPGKYPIQISGKDNPNYTFNWVDGVYTVLPNEDLQGIDDGIDEGTDSGYSDGTVYDSEDGSETSTSDDDWLEDWLASDETWEEWEEKEEKKSKKKKKKEEAAEDYTEITPYSVGNSLVLDGLYQINRESMNSLSTLVIDYWITKDGNIKSIDEMIQLQKTKKGTGKSELTVKPDATSGCYSARDLVLWAKSGEHTIKIVVKKYLCDLDGPEITVNGLEVADGVVNSAEGIKQQNQPITVTVGTVYGVAGKSVLAYKLIAPNSIVDTESDDWKPVKQGTITVDQEFEGQIAILAKDRIGNETVVYTEAFKVDTAAPTVTGIESGAVYDERVSYSVTDSSGVASVVFDGKPVSPEGAVLGGGIHTMVVTDTNGNSKSLTFTVNDANFIGSIIHSFKAVEG